MTLFGGGFTGDTRCRVRAVGHGSGVPYGLAPELGDEGRRRGFEISLDAEAEHRIGVGITVRW